MTDLAKLAAGLTEAQKRAVLYRECYGPEFSTICALRPTLSALNRHGLIGDRCGWWARLSDLGQALRRHLLDQEKVG